MIKRSWAWDLNTMVSILPDLPPPHPFLRCHFANKGCLIRVRLKPAFWAKAYHPRLTYFVSEPTTKATPVGVDFYWIEQRGEQFGPFGSLVPIQLHNQTGRGFFRCNGTSQLWECRISIFEQQGEQFELFEHLVPIQVFTTKLAGLSFPAMHWPGRVWCQSVIE